MAAPPRRIGTTISAFVLMKHCRSLDDIDADPRVMRDLAKLATHEVGDRLPLAAGMDDLLEACRDVIVGHLALLPGHDLAELPHALHDTAPAHRTGGPAISLAASGGRSRDRPGTRPIGVCREGGGGQVGTT